MKSGSLSRLFPFLGLVFLCGCTLRAPLAAAAESPSNPQTVYAAALPTEIIAPAAVEPLPSPVIDVHESVAEIGPDAQPVQESVSTPLPDPLKFTFPTQAADAVSLWRAPLYPVPWEPTPNDHFYFTRPIGANEVNWPLARYRYGYLLYAEPHSGIDIPTPKGTPILAAGPGTVIWAGYGLYFQRNIEQDPYGIAVAIQHDFGYAGKKLFTVYGHMDRTQVYRGQHVQGGEQIGVVGETGKVSGPHLHFEVRVGDDTYFTTRNPELWISPPQGTGVLVGRILQLNGDKAPKVIVRLASTEGSGRYDVLTYAENDVNCDEYYNENLVLGDIPAGSYTMTLDYSGEVFKIPITITAGQVNYITYRYKGTPIFGPPPTPDPGFPLPKITP